MKLRVGDIVRIKYFDKRPLHWNEMGDMDYMMGREVKIKRIASFSVNVINSEWIWMKSDFEPITKRETFDFGIEELFEL